MIDKYKLTQRFYLFFMMMTVSMLSVASPKKKYWAVPTISNVSPASACVGETITLTGTSLATATEVEINGVTVLFVSFISQNARGNHRIE